MNKKGIIYILLAIVVVAICGMLWNKYASTTRVALVNFQKFQVAKMAKSIDNNKVRVRQVGIDEFGKLKKYDAVLIFGMGIRMTDDHREILGKLTDRGMPVYTTAATDPVNNISSLDSLHQERISAYMGNGGKQNYRSMFNYIRRELDGKRFFVGEIGDPIELSGNAFFHLDEDKTFETIEEFEKYYRDHGFYREGAPKVAIVAGYAGPMETNTEHLDSLIVSLERRGINVYPFSSMMKRLDYLQAINPDLVIYMPHGRLLMGQGERAVEWLRQKNIPVICPVTINDTYDSWMADKQGMAGGFLSQSVVTPELDGGIVPFALIAQYIDNDGLYLFKTIPERLEQFTSTVSNYLELRQKANKDKKIAVYYFKGPGAGNMVAAGLEVAPSLYNTLQYLKSQGYTVSGLPDNEKDFEKMIMERGPIFNDYAEGNIDRYVNSGIPALVSGQELNGWMRETLRREQYEAVVSHYGEAPGQFYTVKRDGQRKIAVTRIELGNIVLLPQPTQGTGENSFEVVHGSNPVPPYHYIASYMWMRNAFGADAVIHFGTHGSLEFVPGKQVALSSEDWADQLIYDVPHLYLYTVADVGEGIIAKRRGYATLISHLNPPFIETGLRSEVRKLQDLIGSYLRTELRDEKLNLRIKKMAVEMGLHRDLQLDSILNVPYADAEIEKIDNFAEELCGEKIMGGQYTIGVPFTNDKILSSVELMSIDPIAYSVAALDKLKGKVSQKQLDSKPFFNANYYAPARAAVKRLLANPDANTESIMLSLGVSKADQERAAEIRKAMEPKPNRMMAMMAQSGEVKVGGSGHPAGMLKDGEMPDSVKTQLAAHGNRTRQGEPKPEVSKDERDFANAVSAIEQTLGNVNNYRKGLAESPYVELSSLANALNGGYIAPSSGGDFAANPNVIPSGRNMYSINAEATPSAAAWEKGVELGRNLLEDYLTKHGELPKKVSFTLWSGSFIESEGTTIAQIMYILGVEPIRDQFGRVLDIRLIPEADLGRPRIDVVIQTSGQFRDLAASRLTLLQRAIDMAVAANDSGENYVTEGRNVAEQVLLEKGFTPKEARELSTSRIFGGINGMSGTGITGMIEAGDRWQDDAEIAKVYMNNMGASYGNEKSWGDFRAGVFEAALQNTSVVVQPRQSNTWGALSLDHVYEFMGGLNLTVRQVTGKDPEAYFNDLRNHYNVRIQDLRTAIGVESRATIFNPAYVKEHLKEGSGSAGGFMEIVRNTYGWNVMKPDVIDNQMWDQIYDTYVKDGMNLGVQEFFERENPTALQEMTAIMMETARKGYWDATPEQLATVASLHSDMVERFEAGCNNFTCNNAELKGFISAQLPKDKAARYSHRINYARDVRVSDQSGGENNGNGVVLEKEKQTNGIETYRIEEKGFRLSTAVIVFTIIAVTAAGIFIIKRRKK